jgi:hypothetical protein
MQRRIKRIAGRPEGPAGSEQKRENNDFSRHQERLPAPGAIFFHPVLHGS